MAMSCTNADIRPNISFQNSKPKSDDMNYISKLVVFLLCLLAFSATATRANGLTITGFPVGVGQSIEADFFEPYNAQLKQIADTLKKYPLAQAIVTGRADGIRYRRNNDATNTGLALGRAHTLCNLLVGSFNVDPGQLVVQSIDVKNEGELYRSVTIRVVREIERLDMRVNEIEEKINKQAAPTPAQEVILRSEDNVRIQVGAGMSSSSFGAVPIVSVAIDWKQYIYLEGILGHTFWDGSFAFEGENLDTKRRLVRVQVAIFPFSKPTFGFVGGWMRTEDISQRFYEYVQLAEGPVLGLQVRPYDYITITGAYNPSKCRVINEERAHSKNNQFLLSLTINTSFGGGR